MSQASYAPPSLSAELREEVLRTFLAPSHSINFLCSLRETDISSTLESINEKLSDPLHRPKHMHKIHVEQTKNTNPCRTNPLPFIRPIILTQPSQASSAIELYQNYQMSWALDAWQPCSHMIWIASWASLHLQSAPWDFCLLEMRRISLAIAFGYSAIVTLISATQLWIWLPRKRNR